MSAREEIPSPLEAALAGDADAIERVLGGVTAPIFDLAVHVHRHPVRAELGAIIALRDLAGWIRSGRLPHADPLAVAGRALVQDVPAPGAEPSILPATPLQESLDDLAAEERIAVLAGSALGLEGDDLAFVLGCSLAEAARRWREGLAGIHLDEEALQDALDEEAACVPLARGLVDRAL